MQETALADDELTHFYDDLAADYTALYADWDTAVRQQGEVIYQLMKSLARGATQTVLDATCGIGTQAIGLAMHELTVTGTDLSVAAIERARREARRMGVRAEFRVADVRSLADTIRGPFDAVVSLDNSLPHLITPAGLHAALDNLRRLLRDDGMLLISSRDYDALLVQRPSGEVPRMHGQPGERSMVVQSWNWDEHEPIYTLHQFVICEGPPESWSVRHLVTRYRAWTRQELARAASEAGFVEVRWLDPAETGYFQPVMVGFKR